MEIVAYSEKGWGKTTVENLHIYLHKKKFILIEEQMVGHLNPFPGYTSNKGS
jgi:hypothetical protein